MDRDERRSLALWELWAYNDWGAWLDYSYSVGLKIAFVPPIYPMRFEER